MLSLTLEPTNNCNRRCLHCFVNKADAPGFLPLGLAESILSQAKDLGFQQVHLTGGEVALYSHLAELIRLIVGYGLPFTVVTNGFRFPEVLLRPGGGPGVPAASAPGG
ncbi:MAG: radical SAM protein [Deltaproteobacteria bacterium]|nr:radical SAM protein [Deltaproteobacteria bacterium]